MLTFHMYLGIWGLLLIFRPTSYLSCRKYLIHFSVNHSLGVKPELNLQHKMYKETSENPKKSGLFTNPPWSHFTQLCFQWPQNCRVRGVGGKKYVKDSIFFIGIFSKGKLAHFNGDIWFIISPRYFHKELTDLSSMNIGRFSQKHRVFPFGHAVVGLKMRGSILSFIPLVTKNILLCTNYF